MSVNDVLTINAAAFDLNHVDISSSIVWSDESGNTIATGAMVSLSGFTEGIHNITATATDGSGRTGSFHFDLQVNADPIAIPDLGKLTVSKTVSAPEAVMIDDVNVTLDISHERQDNIDAFLVAPDGTRVELFTDVGNRYGAGFVETTLDSDATQLISDSAGTFSGAFRPEGDLSVFNGKNSEGTWSLEIVDDRRRDIGTLNWWALDISGTPIVPNDPPEIASTPVTTAMQDAAYAYDVDAIDSDRGSTIAYSLDTAPSGMNIDSQTGNINWTPNSGQIGVETVTVRVQDQFGAFDLQTFQIDVANVNDAPIARNDIYELDQDSILNISAPGLLTNDSDADGDPLALIFNTAPSNGTLTVNSDGSFSYTPSTGFVGTDSFTYAITDGVLSSAPANVTLEVNALASDEPLYVYAIRFDSKRGNKDWRAVFEIRSDSNANSTGDSGDGAAAGVSITVTFGGNTYSGITDSNGLFRTPWTRNLARGEYYANVDSLLASGFDWDPLDDLNLEDDTDGDGKPDGLLAR